MTLIILAVAVAITAIVIEFTAEPECRWCGKVIRWYRSR